MGKLSYEDIKILELAKEIKQIVGNRLFLYYIEPQDLTVPQNMKDSKKICKTGNLVKLFSIKTEHSLVGYKGEFRPILKEVFEQFPEKLENAVAFRVVDDNGVTDFDKDCGKVTFYKLGKGNSVPEEVKNQDVIYRGVHYSAKEIDEMQK